MRANFFQNSTTFGQHVAPPSKVMLHRPDDLSAFLVDRCERSPACGGTNSSTIAPTKEMKNSFINFVAELFSNFSEDGS